MSLSKGLYVEVRLWPYQRYNSGAVYVFSLSFSETMQIFIYPASHAHTLLLVACVHVHIGRIQVTMSSVREDSISVSNSLVLSSGTEKVHFISKISMPFCSGDVAPSNRSALKAEMLAV